MPTNVTEEILVPSRHGRAFRVEAGQVFSVTAHEGKQVGDLTMVRADDYDEHLNIFVTASAAGRNMFMATDLYSGPPEFNVLARVVHDDGQGMHFLQGRCTRLRYRQRPQRDNSRNCHDNLVEAFSAYGLERKQVPFDTFNVFMVVQFDEKGTYVSKPPIIDVGAHIDFRAEMDLIVGLSACPAEDGINDGEPKGLRVTIYDGQVP